MSTSSSSSSATGDGFAVRLVRRFVGLLGIAFVVLKLIGVIDWSWWLVTLPFWGGLALVLVVLGALGFGVTALVRSR